MHYMIDARLEQRDPQIRILECATGRCRLHWSGAGVWSRLEAGGLCPQDFCRADKHCVQALVRRLFLLSTAEAIAARQHGNANTVKPTGQRSWVAVKFDRHAAWPAE